MKKKFLIALAVVLTLSLTMAFPTATSAKATKVQICGLQKTEIVDSGKVWFTDDFTMMHIRGEIERGTIEFIENPECDSTFTDGTIEMVVNINLNLITGQGTVFGTHVITSNESDASWVGSFTGKIKETGFSGKSISHGSGDWEGYLEKVSIEALNENEYAIDGYVLIP